MDIDTLNWLQDCTCTDGRTVADFFLPPGRVLAADVAEACRRCPTRRQEIALAYTLPIPHGYVGGLSPQQRRTMTLDEALAFVDNDPPAVAA